MEFNNKKLARTTAVAFYIISIFLAVFLIGLATIIIGDIDETDNRPIVANYEAQTNVEQHRQLLSKIQDTIYKNEQLKEAIIVDLDLAQSLLTQQKQSFKSWIATGRALQSNKVNDTVQARNDTMDSLTTAIQLHEKKIASLRTTTQQLENQAAQQRLLERKEMNIAYDSHQIAVRKYELTIFLKRLIFVLPILLLGLWMLLRKRNSAYWPLYRGFVFFAFYAFFIGLIPYLPSYGGYIRYTIGIVLSLFLGRYVIQRLQAFVRQKKEELQQSTQLRSMQIKQDVAEKALENHMCPSCGKDYLIKSYHTVGDKKVAQSSVTVSNYCRYCGLELFKDCSSCATVNYAHLPYCYSCGDHILQPSESEENLNGHTPCTL